MTPAKQHMLRLLMENVEQWLDVRPSDDGFSTTVEFRWDGPRVWRMSVREDAAFVPTVQPPSMTLDEWVRNTLPGLWGYIPERERATKMCLWCGKAQTKTEKERAA